MLISSQLCLYVVQQGCFFFVQTTTKSNDQAEMNELRVLDCVCKNNLNCVCNNKHQHCSHGDLCHNMH